MTDYRSPIFYPRGYPARISKWSGKEVLFDLDGRPMALEGWDHRPRALLEIIREWEPDLWCDKVIYLTDQDDFRLSHTVARTLIEDARRGWMRQADPAVPAGVGIDQLWHIPRDGLDTWWECEPDHPGATRYTLLGLT